MSLEGAEAVQVKVEPGLETEVDAHDGHIAHEVKKEPKSEIELAARPAWYTELATEECESKANPLTIHIDHEEKEELRASAGACGVSEAAARAGLYPDHSVKKELVLGPEELHRPKWVFLRPESLSTAERIAVAGRACSVMLEYMHVDLKRRVCRIGPHTYTFRLWLETPHDNNMQGPTEQEFGTRQQTMKNSMNDGQYKCGGCSYSSAYKIKFRRHLKTHTRGKPYKCAYCSYKSAHKGNLKAHEKAHISGKPHKCTYCSYATGQKRYLEVHLRTHTGEKPYKCAHCSYTSNRKNNLRLHEMVHTSEKPHKCPHCSYSSARNVDLQLHIRKHTNEKPYKCDHCDFASAYKRCLRVHEITRTGEKPHKCPHCSFYSARKNNLKVHVRRHEK